MPTRSSLARPPSGNVRHREQRAALRDRNDTVVVVVVERGRDDHKRDHKDTVVAVERGRVGEGIAGKGRNGGNGKARADAMAVGR